MLNLTSITSFGYTFYENPVHGDEAPLMVMFEGKYYETDMYDAPFDQEEAKQTYEEAIAGVALCFEFERKITQ